MNFAVTIISYRMKDVCVAQHHISKLNSHYSGGQIPKRAETARHEYANSTHCVTGLAIAENVQQRNIQLYSEQSGGESGHSVDVLVGRASVVIIATRYGLESRWDQDFPVFQTGPGVHPATYTISIGYIPGVKRPGCGVNHPPPSSTEVEKRVDLYIYSPFGPSWSVVWRTLSFLPLSLFCK